MLLAVDVGNTHTVLGIFEGDRLLADWRLASLSQRTADESWLAVRSFCAEYDISPRSLHGVGISSVVPDLTAIYETMARKYLHAEPVTVSGSLDLGIRIDYRDPTAVGADRICNAVAGYAMYGGPLVIIDFGTATTKVCGGTTPDCLDVGVALYGQAIDKVVPVSSTRVAEMTKLLENIHRAVNIGLANEMEIVADRMGIDIHEVIRAAATKPFGFVPYYPGPGLGGHCIPIDPFYLTWKAREYGLNTQFIELAGQINRTMPAWVVDKIAAALNDRKRSVKGSRILVLGIAYKKNVDDVRESPAAAIMELLRDRGALLGYSDPYVPRFPKMREHQFALARTPLTADTLAAQDCVVLVTDHDLFDFDFIAANSSLIVDSRGRYQTPRDNVIRA